MRKVFSGMVIVVLAAVIAVIMIKTKRNHLNKNPKPWPRL